MDDIPGCNGVARWNAGMQGYEQYIPGIPSSDFDVRAGHPYDVNVTANVTWPSGETPKRARGVSRAVRSERTSSAPHAVWGRIHIHSDADGVGFRASILSRMGEILTADSPGCVFQDGIWVVQCGAFPSAWRAGDVLRVDFYGTKDSVLCWTEVELTHAPTDQADDLTFQEFLLPDCYALGPNFPNPFNACTKIPFQVPEPGRVRIRIYNLLGREIRTLLN